MAARHGTGYTLAFAAAVCLVCSILVCLAAVGLKDRQEENRRLDRQKNVLLAATLITADEKPSRAELRTRFENVKALVIELATGLPQADIDPMRFDAEAAATDPVPTNPAGITKIAKHAVVYQVRKNGQPDMWILPIKGKGLWSTMYGFLALDQDTRTVRGISFYDHGETPGLGGEITNTGWTARWVGRQVLDESFKPVFQVIKGSAGTIAADPFRVDGISGATLTGNGVTATVRFWLGEHGFGPFLTNLREGKI